MKDEPMVTKTIISVSGLRGIVGQSIDPLIAIRYALAFGSCLPAGRVLVARDGRETGEMFAQALSSGLMAAGFDVLNAGVCATPTVGVLVREQGCTGGIQISASHNPPEYNGLKLFGPDGRVISSEEGKAVIEAFEKNDFQWVDFDQVGQTDSLGDTTSAHLRKVLETVDVDRIRSRNFKVVLDSNHGAGSVLARPLFEALNCDARILGDQPNGQFAHVPEPTAANLAKVAEDARSFEADVVFCQDPDADRLAIIDEQGEYIGEEYTLAITLRHALASASSAGAVNSKVVINCATSRMSIDLAEEFGCQCIVSAVGEANVTNAMIEHGALYGGEGNGGPIDPRVGMVRDSFVAMAQTLDAMAARDKTPSELAQEIRSYSIVKSKVQIDQEKILEVFDALEAEFPNARADRLDGLRLDFPESWLLVRASNTEPVVRVIAEATNYEIARGLVSRATGTIESLG
ncbi:MAG: phosphoglucosamine mutase [Planctomycetota bacterium]|nr:phosphoglucosamine mutase [Planctomycetota bacterium]